MIITEISKEVEKNTITRVNSYSKQYVSRRNGGVEDHMEEVVVVDVLDPTFVYTFICVEIKTNTERVASRVFQKVQTTLVRKTQFF